MATYTVKAGDTLNKIASQYGFKNYKEAGITSVPSGNFDLIRPGDVITIGGAKEAPKETAPVVAPPVKTMNQYDQNTGLYASGSNITDTKTADEAINAGQQQDFKQASAKDEPPVRSSSNYQDVFKTLTDTITKALPAKVESPNLVETYNKLKLDAGVTDLEKNLTDLKKEADTIKQQFQMTVDKETGKPVPTNVISGRLSEEEKAANQRLSVVNDSIKTLSDQLTTKYNTIETVMKLTESDYDNATSNYDKQYSQAIQLINTVKGIVDTDKSNEEQAIDDARANLSIIYNNITAGGTDVSSLSQADRLNISKLELKAGLPQGFYQNLTAKNPKADILSTTTRESDGKKYADVIMKNDDGSLTTKSILMGSVSGSGSTSEKDQVRKDADMVTSQLDEVAGQDGFLSPDDYKKARKAWVSAGYTSKDFDDRFAKGYVNPDHYGDYSVSSDYFF